MSFKQERVNSQPSLRALIGEPSLLRGEDKDAYELLRASVERELNPQTIFDEMRVQEIAGKFWEELRLKRQQIALIQSAKVESLASLLSPYYGDEIEEALDTARNYSSGDQPRRRKAQKTMEQLGITEQQVEAHGVHVRSIGLLALDRMILSREISRNRLIREHERKVRRAEKARRKAPLNDN